MTTILKPIEDLLGFLIAFIYNIVPNLGLSIILVTMLLMLCLYPLTHKQQKSMLAVQTLAPKLKEVQAKYKDDKQKQQEETMKLYRENGAHPLGSCLPTLIQMPFFISIFRVVKDIQKFIGTDTKLFKSICDSDVSGVVVKTVKECHSNVGGFQKLGANAADAERLASQLPRSKNFLGLDLSRNLSGVMNQPGSNTMALIAIFVILVLIVIAAYVNIARQQSRNPAQSNKLAFIKYLIPAGTGFFSIFLPGGSNLYLLTSAVWRAAQQEVFFHKVITPHREREATKEKELETKLPEIKGVPSEADIKASVTKPNNRKKRKKK